MQIHTDRIKEYFLLAFLRVSIFASDRHGEIRLKRWKVSVHTTQSIEYWSDMCFAYQPLFLWSILDVAAFMKNQNENCTRRFHENHLISESVEGVSRLLKYCRLDDRTAVNLSPSWSLVNMRTMVRADYGHREKIHI